MRAFDRLAARTGAAGHAADEQRAASTSPSFSSGTQASRMAVAKQPGWPTCGVVDLLQVLRHRAGELRQAMRRAMRMLVDGLVGGGGGVAKVRRDVHDARLGAGGFGGLQQLVDERRRCAMRRGARTSRRSAALATSASISSSDVNFVSPKALARCGKAFATGSPGWLSDRTPASCEVRMTCDQAQQFAGHIAGAAEHDGGNAALLIIRYAGCAAPRNLRQPDRIDDAVAQRRAIR